MRDWTRWKEAYSSELARVEARRVIDRLRLDSQLDDEGVSLAHAELGRIEQAIAFIGLTPLILGRASGPMPTAVKTLDAIHLASALVLREHQKTPLVLATHDRQQSLAAVALGFACVG